MTRGLLIFVVVAVVGVALHLSWRPSTETSNAPVLRRMTGEAAIRFLPIVDSRKLQPHPKVNYKVSVGP